MNNLYKLIEDSRLTLIGYTYKNERLKDTFISKFNPVIISEIDESFSLQSYLRDVRIDSIIGNSSISNRYILIDLTDIHIRSSLKYDMVKPKIVKKIVEDLRICSALFGFKPILTSAMYRTFNGDGQDISAFRGGMTPVYSSDLVITFGDEHLSVVKSRASDNFKINYSELKENSYI